MALQPMKEGAVSNKKNHPLVPDSAPVDFVAEFFLREKAAKKNMKLSAICFLAYFLAFILASVITQRMQYSATPLQEVAFSLTFWTAIVFFIIRAERAYRCPRCRNRPFHIIGKGLTYSYDVQQELTKELSEGKCQHCRALLKKPEKFRRQRRKW